MWEKKCTTLDHLCNSDPAKRRKMDREACVKFTVQEHRPSKRLRPNLVTTKCSAIFPYHHSTQGLFIAVPLPSASLSGCQGKNMRHTKKQKTQLD